MLIFPTFQAYLLRQISDENLSEDLIQSTFLLLIVNNQLWLASDLK